MPASRASISWQRSAKPVTMIIGSADRCASERISRASSMPLMPGICRSSSTTSTCGPFAGVAQPRQRRRSVRHAARVEPDGVELLQKVGAHGDAVVDDQRAAAPRL